jgi:hypothetical protein
MEADTLEDALVESKDVRSCTCRWFCFLSSMPWIHRHSRQQCFKSVIVLKPIKDLYTAGNVVYLYIK